MIRAGLYTLVAELVIAGAFLAGYGVGQVLR